jgi:hypothetical protein
MHCSDLGRLAFLDAQKRMNTINTIARALMEDGGKISYIVELLEDPADARNNLKPEMDAVKARAIECSNECEEIKKRFDYWHLVINHLSVNALDLSGNQAPSRHCRTW